MCGNPNSGKAQKIKVNGKVYNSLNDAARGVGISQRRFCDLANKLKDSARKSMEFEVRILTTIELEKVT